MYCEHCGSMIREDARYCRNCGVAAAPDTNNNSTRKKYEEHESGLERRAIAEPVARAEPDAALAGGEVLTWALLWGRLGIGLTIYAVATMLRGLNLYGTSDIGLLALYATVKAVIFLILFLIFFLPVLAFRKFKVSECDAYLSNIGIAFAVMMVFDIISFSGYK